MNAKEREERLQAARERHARNKSAENAPDSTREMLENPKLLPENNFKILHSYDQEQEYVSREIERNESGVLALYGTVVSVRELAVKQARMVQEQGERVDRLKQLLEDSKKDSVDGLTTLNNIAPVRSKGVQILKNVMKGVRELKK